MNDKLHEILAGLFDLEGEDDGLLAPVRRLEQVVRLETTSHLGVRVIYPEVLCLVPPCWQLAHHKLLSAVSPQLTHNSSNTHNAKVEDRVSLLGEAHDLVSPDTQPAREWSEYVKSDKLTDE